MKKILLISHLLIITASAFCQADSIVQVGTSEYSISYRTNTGKLFINKWIGSTPGVYNTGLDSVTYAADGQYVTSGIRNGRAFSCGSDAGGTFSVHYYDLDNAGQPFHPVNIKGFYESYLAQKANKDLYYLNDGVAESANDVMNYEGGNGHTAWRKLNNLPGGRTIEQYEVTSSAPTGNAYPSNFYSSMTMIMVRANDSTCWYYVRGDLSPHQMTTPQPVIKFTLLSGAIVIETVDNLYTKGLLASYAGGVNDPRFGAGNLYDNSLAWTSVKSVWVAAGVVFPTKELVGNYNTLHIIDQNNHLFGSGQNSNGEVGNGKEVSPWRLHSPAWLWGFSNNDFTQAPVQIPGEFKNLQTGTTVTFYIYVQDLGNNWYSWGRNKALVLGNGVTLTSTGYAIYPDAYNVPAPRPVHPLTQIWAVTNPFLYNVEPGPLANAGINQYLPTVTTTTLYGQGSSQQDGTLVAYLWTEVTSTGAILKTPTAKNTDVSGLTIGTHVFRITVTNNLGVTNSQDVIVVISAPVIIVPTIHTTTIQWIPSVMINSHTIEWKWKLNVTEHTRYSGLLKRLSTATAFGGVTGQIPATIGDSTYVGIDINMAKGDNQYEVMVVDFINGKLVTSYSPIMTVKKN